MRKLKLSYFLIALLLVLSCEEELPEEVKNIGIVISESSAAYFDTGLKLSKEAQSAEISFTTTDDWSVSVSKDWLKADPASGTAGEHTVRLKVEENTSFTERDVVVTVTCGKVSKALKVHQAASTPIEVTSISLNLTEAWMEVGESVTLKATVLPEDATDPGVTWTSSNTAVASVKDGKVSALKLGKTTITAQAGSQKATCEITVEKYEFSITPEGYELIAGPGTIDFTITASRTYQVDSAPEWISLSATDGDVMTFAVAANESRQSRTGSIIICDAKGTCISLSVFQDGYSAFAISPETVNIPEEGGAFEITISCPTSYKLPTLPSWIHDLSSPTNRRKLVYQVDRQPAEEDRTASLVICDAGGTCISCVVAQKGHVPESASGGNEEVPDGDPINW